jgi:hypothetical protein
MKPVNVTREILEAEGYRVVGIAHLAINQNEYETLASAYIDLDSLPDESTPVLTRWLPSPEELERLNAGEPIEMITLTFGNAFMPVILSMPGEWIETDAMSTPFCPTCGGTSVVDGDCPRCNPPTCEACEHPYHFGECNECTCPLW